MSHWPYLPFLLVWALPVIALQWLVGWRYLWRERHTWPWIVLGLGAYFTLADAVAISAHIWTFDTRALARPALGPVPLEEILFYLLTAAMVVQGYVLFSAFYTDCYVLLSRWRARLTTLRTQLSTLRKRIGKRIGMRFQASTDVPDSLATKPTARRWQFAGSWAALLALAPTFLLAAILAVPTSLEPLTEFVMQATPIYLASGLITTLGPLARTFALLGGLAITLPIGGLLTLAAPPLTAPRPAHVPWRSLADLRTVLTSPWTRRWALTVALALLVCLPLALTAAYAGEAVCALLAGLLFAPALAFTRRVERALDRRTVTDALPYAAWTPSRRVLLKGIAASGATVAVALTLGSFELWSNAVATVLGRAETIRTLFAFTPPAARKAGFPVAGVEPEVTPVSQFYLLDKNDVNPLVAPADWSLRLTGAVQRSLSLSYVELLALPRIDEYSTLRCVSNPIGGHLMSTALWSGVSLATILRHAGVRSDAATLVLHAPDAYDEVIPLDAALHPATLLVYGMNGQSLIRKHGGPVRALIPGYFGFKNVKWIDSITVQTTSDSGYWEQRGWTADTVHPVSRIDVWQRTSAGLLVAGVAFTGVNGVSASQLRVDGGAWQNCKLNIPSLSPLTWVQWRVTLPIAPGKYTLTARVIDAAGLAQDDATANIKPAGAYGLHTVEVNA